MNPESEPTRREPEPVDHTRTFSETGRELDLEQHTLIERDPALYIIYRRNDTYSSARPFLQSALERCGKEMGIEVHFLTYENTQSHELIAQQLHRLMEQREFSGSLVVTDRTVKTAWSLNQHVRTQEQIFLGETLDNRFCAECYQALSQMHEKATYVDSISQNGKPLSREQQSVVVDKVGRYVSFLFERAFRHEEPDQIVLCAEHLMDHPPFHRFYRLTIEDYLRGTGGDDKLASPAQTGGQDALASMFSFSRLVRRIGFSSRETPDDKIIRLDSELLGTGTSRDGRATAYMNVLLGESGVPPKLKAAIEKKLQIRLPNPDELVAGWIRKAGYPANQITILRDSRDRRQIQKLRVSGSKRVWALLDTQAALDSGRLSAALEQGSAVRFRGAKELSPSLRQLNLPIQNLINGMVTHGLLPAEDLPNADRLAEAVAQKVLKEAVWYRQSHLFACDRR